MEIKEQMVMKAANLTMKRRSKVCQKELNDWSNILASILKTLVEQQGRAEQTQLASMQPQGSMTQKGAKAMKKALGKMMKMKWCQAMLKGTAKAAVRSSGQG